MKRHLLSYMAVAAVLCSCSRGGDVPVPSDGSISFSVGTSSVTKAYTEATEATLRKDGFTVAAIDTGGSMMFNRHAVYSDGSWLPEGGPYWWPAGSVTFCGAYPCDVPVTVEGGSVSLDYTHTPGTDLLTACTVTPRTENAVSLTFGHALSLIRFEALAKDPSVIFRVKSVSVRVPSSGSWSFASRTWTAGGGTVDETCSSSVTELPKDGTPATIEGAVTAVPCAPVVTVEWDTYAPDGVTLIRSHSDSRTVMPALEAGKEYTVTAQLSDEDAQQMVFTVSIRPWEDALREIELK